MMEQNVGKKTYRPALLEWTVFDENDVVKTSPTYDPLNGEWHDADDGNW